MTNVISRESVMRFEPQKVDAECWMGEDNERPSNSDDSVVFTSTYDGNGDLWAIGKLENRSGINTETYSCVWGMKNVGSTAETNVYESTNTDPLRARDGGTQDITYDIIENRRVAADISEGTPRNVWADYQHPDDGGEDERTYALQNHFLLNGEYPYCSGNSFFSSNPERTTNTLNNIICEGSGGYSGISWK